jgi:hypothetical protein
MNTVLEKLQFVEARMQALEEQLKAAKIEALEQRSRAEVAETWLKIKNRKIVFMEEMDLEHDVTPPPPSKNSTSWDTVTIPCQVSVERTLPSITSPKERRTSLPSPTKSERRTSLPSPTKSERRTSISSVGQRSMESPKRT